MILKWEADLAGRNFKPKPRIAVSEVIRDTLSGSIVKMLLLSKCSCLQNSCSVEREVDDGLEVTFSLNDWRHNCWCDGKFSFDSWTVVDVVVVDCCFFVLVLIRFLLGRLFEERAIGRRKIDDVESSCD